MGTTTTITSSVAPGAAPSGFSLANTFYDAQTTAAFSGTVTVTLPYDESQLTCPEANLRLLHWENGAWQDITVSPVDTVNNEITGQVSSFSPFGFGMPNGAPPTTTISTDPTSPNGTNDWFITTPKITLASSEPGTTYYKWDSSAPAGDPTWTEYTGPFDAQEGNHTLYYYSEDAFNNAEAPQSVPMKVDTMQPQIGFSAPSAEQAVSGTVAITGTANDANFAEYTLQYGAGKRPTGRYASTPWNGCDQSTWWRTIVTSSMPVLGSTLGSWSTASLDNSYHTLRLIVKDQAGNTRVSLIPVKTSNPGRPYLEEVTTDPLDFLPDMSADGQKIAFMSDKLGNLDTWFMNADGSNLTSIRLPSDDRHPSFSPDGQQIVFQSRMSGNFDIWKINIDGTGLTQLTTGPADEWTPTWSNDGQKIVYANGTEGARDIFIMNADGSGQLSLTTDPGDDWMPDISPNGTRIAFNSNRNGSYDIFVMNTDTSGLTQLTTATSDDRHPSFSPDGQRVAFHSSRSGQADIWMMNVDGTNPQRLTDDPAPDAVPAWSPDGNKIVFGSGRSGLCDIYSMNADGTNEQRLTFSTDDFIPDINHDSSKIAFSSNRARGYNQLTYTYRQGDVYLVDADGANLSPLSDLSYYSYHPSFSPDGQSLGFTSDLSGNEDIWKANTDGTGLTQLTATLSQESVPTWNSNKIVCASDPLGNDDIFIMNSDGTGTTALTASPAAERFPDVSADGQKVAFSSYASGPGDVCVINANGTGLVQLTTDPLANEWHPSFSPEGNRISYTISAANPDLYVMNADGTGSSRLTYDQATDTVQTWGADGKTIVFSTSRATGDAGKMTIWKMTFEGPQTPTLRGPATSNDGQVKLHGTASANAQVKIFEGGNEIASAIADGAGNWHAAATLMVGTHTLTASATVSGQTSDLSAPLVVVVSPAVPEIGTPEATNNVGFHSVPDPDTNISEVTSLSWTSLNINVPVSNNPTSVTAVIAGHVYTLTDPDADGTFSLTLNPGTLPPGPGSYEVEVTVSDSSGSTYTQPVMQIELIDPSGYVYDATLGESVRISGATATLYAADGTQWDAALYGQVNPQITDSEGRYGWDVPAGGYYVVVTKPGYNTATSPTVTIPPPVTDLNIPLQSTGVPAGPATGGNTVVMLLLALGSVGLGVWVLKKRYADEEIVF